MRTTAEVEMIEIATNANTESSKPFVITICSGKGGVGKSVLAGNLAYNISQKGNNVLLWDANIHFPNQHILCGVEPPIRVSDVYLNRVQVGAAIFQFSPNMSLLADRPGGMEKPEGESMIHDTYEKIINSGIYDYIIIDSPAAISNDILQSCSLSDLICMVITDEPTSLLDAYGLLKILLEYFDNDKMKLLVNNVIDSEDADEITNKLNLATEKFLKLHLDVIGVIPYDRAVRQSIMAQELFMIGSAHSEVAESIKRVSDNIISLKNKR
jgi:flagellar biosynthesis protein FlhG